MDTHYCEVCGEVNLWPLVSYEHSYVCKACVEVGDDVGFNEEAEVWRKVDRCPGCGRTGMVNYGEGYRLVFYCGGSPYCCP